MKQNKTLASKKLSCIDFCNCFQYTKNIKVGVASHPYQTSQQVAATCCWGEEKVRCCEEEDGRSVSKKSHWTQQNLDSDPQCTVHEQSIIFFIDTYIHSI